MTEAAHLPNLYANLPETIPVAFNERDYLYECQRIERRLPTSTQYGLGAGSLLRAAGETLSSKRQLFLASLDTAYCAQTLELFERVATQEGRVPHDDSRSARYRVGQIIMTNFDAFAAIAESDDPALSQQATTLILDAFDCFGTFGQDDRGVRQTAFVVERLRDRIAQPDSRAINTLEVLIDRHIELCDQANQQQVVKMVHQLIFGNTSSAVASTGTHMLETLVKYLDWGAQRQKLTVGVQEGLYAQFGVDFKNLSRAWANGHRRGSPANYERMNIEMMVNLEDRKPGICKALHERFGIANFARLPAEIWEDMYDNIDNKDIEYGVMLYPESDYNSAFYQMKDKTVALYRKLKDLGCHLRVYECATVADAERALMDAERLYERQLAFAIACGHGQPKSLQFGNQGNGFGCERLLFNDVERASSYGQAHRLKRLAKQFVKGAQLMLISCSTGKGGEHQSLGGILARVLGILVTAPNMPVAPAALDAFRDDAGNIRLSIAYHEALALTMAFDARKEVQDDGALYGFSKELMMGTAVLQAQLRARQLQASPVQRIRIF